jgi:hypothetical protein
MAASSHRRSVLQELAALPDVIEQLGGPSGVPQVIAAVEDVARWWPDTP